MSKAFEYVNRMGYVYYLQIKPGKANAIKYSFAVKLSGTPVERMPEGYEPHENPATGQVTIRRILTSSISPQEKQLLEETIGRLATVLFIVDVEERALVVYATDMDAVSAEVRVNFMRQMAPMDEETATRMKKEMLANARYTKMLRFTLIDAEKRLFNIDRWPFSGGTDDWLFLSGPDTLPTLAEKYVGHLGKESFFRLA